MKHAVEARDAGDLRTSIIDLKNILQKDSKRADARLLLGQIYIDIGDANSAEKELKVAQKLGSDETKIHILLGRARLVRGDYEGVLHDYEVPGDATAAIKSRIYLIRGKAHLARTELDDAEKDFQAANSNYKRDIEVERPHLKLTEPPEYVEALIGLTNVMIKRREWETAQSRLDRANALAPDNAEVLGIKGELAFKIKNFAESKDAFEKALKHQPYNLRYKIGIARAELLLKEPEKAEKVLGAVLKFYPDNIIANYYLCLAKLQQDDFQAAYDIALRILKNKPNYLDAHMVVGLASFGLKNFEQANISLKRYLAAVPNDANARRMLGLAQLHLKESDEALKTLQPLSEEAPKDTGLLTLIASAAAGRGDLVLAGKYLQKAVSLKPDDQNTRLRLAALNMAAGNRDDALKELQRVIDLAPNDLRSKYLIMQVHLKSKEFEKALSAAKELEDADPGRPTPFIGAGLAYAGLKQWPEALSSFEKALQIEPGQIAAAYAIADIQIMKKDFAGLRKTYERILQERPGDLSTLIRLIALSEREKKPDEAAALIEKAIEANPNAPAPRVLKAQELIERNEPVKAIAILRDVYEDNKDNPALLLVLGRAQLGAAKPGEATATLEHLERLRPQLPAVHFLLANAYGMFGNNKKLIAELDRTLELDPDFVPAAIARVRTLMIEKNTDEAKTHLAALKKKYPDRFDVASLDAWVAMRDSRPRDASKILERLSANVHTEDLALRLAAARWAANERDQGVTELEAWVAENPATVRAKLELGNYLMLQDKTDKARAIYAELAEAAPQNWLVANNLAGLLKSDDPKKALEYAERAVKLAPNTPPVTITLADILLEQKHDYNRVVKLMRPLAKQYTDNQQIYVLLARAYAGSGDKGHAADLLTGFIDRTEDAQNRQEAEKLLHSLQQ